VPEQEPEEQVQVQTSVIVVSHNRRDQLWFCLESLERSVDRDRIEILVVDNGSQDGSAQLDSDFPEVRWIRLARNFGLTKAWNIGVRAATGEFVFLLHDDTEVEPEAISELARQLEGNAGAVAVCPLLVNPDGTPAPQLGLLPAPGRKAGAPFPAECGEEPEEVEYASGAALMIRKYFIHAMRQIDERYGQYWSDAEICYQIRHAGKKILLVPYSRVLHHGSGVPETELEAADWALGLAKYLGKHYGFGYRLASQAGAVLSALAGFHLRRAGYLLSGQKIDGSQAGA
jgi:GT2 family glycosyltransferase